MRTMIHLPGTKCFACPFQPGSSTCCLLLSSAMQVSSSILCVFKCPAQGHLPLQSLHCAQDSQGRVLTLHLLSPFPAVSLLGPFFFLCFFFKNPEDQQNVLNMAENGTQVRNIPTSSYQPWTTVASISVVFVVGWTPLRSKNHHLAAESLDVTTA